MIPESLTVWNHQWRVERAPTFSGGADDSVFGRVAYSPRSRVLVCPRCQRHWATLALAGDLDLPAYPAWCDGCGFADAVRPVPGSILIEEGYDLIDTALLAALPKELLVREFRLHCAALDKGNLRYE